MGNAPPAGHPPGRSGIGPSHGAGAAIARWRPQDGQVSPEVYQGSLKPLKRAQAPLDGRRALF
jgi:hypothetical protein